MTTLTRLFDEWEMKGLNPIPGLLAPVATKEVSPASSEGQVMLAACKRLAVDFNAWVLTDEGKAPLAKKRAENDAKEAADDLHRGPACAAFRAGQWDAKENV